MRQIFQQNGIFVGEMFPISRRVYVDCTRNVPVSSCYPTLQGSESQEDQETNNNINSEMEDGLAPSPGSSSESPKEVRLNKL